MNYNEPLVSGFYLARGFFCGSVLAGAILTPYGILVSMALLAIAIVIFIDSIFIYHRKPYFFCFLLAFMAGIGLCMLFWVAGIVNIYMLVVFIMMSIAYLHQYMSYKEGRK